MNCDKFAVCWTENNRPHSCHNLSKNGVRVLILKLVGRGISVRDINIRKEEEKC